MPDNLAVYRKAVLQLGNQPRLVLRVETRLTSAEIGALQALGLGSQLAIITPFNPLDEQLSAAENQQRLAELACELADAGIMTIPADGGSADGSHVESGFAFNATLDQGLDIGRRWGQRAIFWFDGTAFRVVGT